VRKVTGQNDEPKLDFEALTAQQEQSRFNTAEAQTDKNSKKLLEKESENEPKKEPKKVSEKEAQKERLFVELQQRADAVDKVMTKNGPPEFDLTSG
jgi:hypothetical protein